MKTNNLFFNAGSVFLILSFILTLTFLNAQSYCSTPATMRQIEKRPIISEMPFNLNHYCLKVYFHVIQTSSGVGDQTQQTVEQAFQILRSEEHTSELQSRPHLVCRLLLEKKKQ